jgi:hypothetical protein
MSVCERWEIFVAPAIARKARRKKPATGPSHGRAQNTLKSFTKSAAGDLAQGEAI